MGKNKNNTNKTQKSKNSTTQSYQDEALPNTPERKRLDAERREQERLEKARVEAELKAKEKKNREEEVLKKKEGLDLLKKLQTKDKNKEVDFRINTQGISIRNSDSISSISGDLVKEIKSKIEKKYKPLNLPEEEALEKLAHHDKMKSHNNLIKAKLGKNGDFLEITKKTREARIAAMKQRKTLKSSENENLSTLRDDEKQNARYSSGRIEEEPNKNLEIKTKTPVLMIKDLQKETPTKAIPKKITKTLLSKDDLNYNPPIEWAKSMDQKVKDQSALAGFSETFLNAYNKFMNNFKKDENKASVASASTLNPLSSVSTPKLPIEPVSVAEVPSPKSLSPRSKSPLQVTTKKESKVQILAKKFERSKENNLYETKQSKIPEKREISEAMQAKIKTFNNKQQGRGF